MGEPGHPRSQEQQDQPQCPQEALRWPPVPPPRQSPGPPPLHHTGGMGAAAPSSSSGGGRLGGGYPVAPYSMQFIPMMYHHQQLPLPPGALPRQGAAPMQGAAGYFELQPPPMLPMTMAVLPPYPIATVNPNSGLHTPAAMPTEVAPPTPAPPSVMVPAQAAEHRLRQEQARALVQRPRAEQKEEEEGRIVRRQRVGPEPVVHGWVLVGDRVLRTVRGAWEGTMGALLNEGRFGRLKAAGFMHMMEGFARANRSRSGAEGEPSAGVVPALRALLAAHPALLGPDAAAPRHQQPIHSLISPSAASTYDALHKRLAQDEGACYLIEESFHGARTVRCSERMAEMFISTEELQGLVDQTGLAVGHLMMRLVKSPKGVDQLARDLASMCFDDYSVKSSVDAPVTCQTRTGESVRCLSTIGVHIDEAGRHILILRLWPLVTRDLVVAPKQKPPQQQPPLAQAHPTAPAAPTTTTNLTVARTDSTASGTTAATGMTRMDSSDSAGTDDSGGALRDWYPPPITTPRAPQQPAPKPHLPKGLHPVAVAAARAHASVFVPWRLVYDAHGRPVLPKTQEEHKAAAAPHDHQQRPIDNRAISLMPLSVPAENMAVPRPRTLPAPGPVPMPVPHAAVGVDACDDASSLTSLSSGGSSCRGGGSSVKSSGPPAPAPVKFVVVPESPPQPGPIPSSSSSPMTSTMSTSSSSSSSNKNNNNNYNNNYNNMEPRAPPPPASAAASHFPFLERVALTSDEGDAVTALLGMRGTSGSSTPSSPVVEQQRRREPIPQSG